MALDKFESTNTENKLQNRIKELEEKEKILVKLLSLINSLSSGLKNTG